MSYNNGGNQIFSLFYLLMTPCYLPVRIFSKKSTSLELFAYLCLSKSNTWKDSLR